MKAAQAAEREVLERLRAEKRAKDERNFRALEQIMLEGRRQREQENMRRNDNSSFEVPAVNPHTGENVLDLPEADSLRQRRKERVDKWEQRSADAELAVPVDVPPPLPPAMAAAPARDKEVSQFGKPVKDTLKVDGQSGTVEAEQQQMNTPVVECASSFKVSAAPPVVPEQAKDKEKILGGEKGDAIKCCEEQGEVNSSSLSKEGEQRATETPVLDIAEKLETPCEVAAEDEDLEQLD